MRFSPALVTFLALSCASSPPSQRLEPFASALLETGPATAPAGESAPTWRLEPLAAPPLRDLPYGVILDPERDVVGSVSVGTASTGVLVQAHELPLDADTMYVLPTHWSRHAHYATDELADLLERAGARLAARFPGTRIPMGDASGREGGDIPHHASHNSGRDVDVPFLVRRTNGEVVPTTGFIPFGPDLTTGRLAFDVERNWYLLRYVVEESHGTLQWAFCARWLQRPMLDWAIANGEPKDAIRMAADALWQPGDAAPHDDHFHFRLYCPAEDRLEGCVETGPVWAWAEHGEDAFETRVGELTRALTAPEVDTRLDAIAFLTRMDGWPAGPRLASLLAEQSAEVQLASLAALQQFHTPGVGRQVVSLVHSADDPRVREAALATLVTYPMPEAAEELVAMAAEGPDDVLPSGPPVCREAARGLLEIQDPAIVPSLINALDSSDGETRSLIAQVLRRTTGRVDGLDWRWASASTRREAIEGWRVWYDARQDEDWVAWLQDSFGERGYTLPAALESRAALEVLIDASQDSEPIGYIANRLLRDVTGESGPPAQWRASQQREYWENVASRFE